MKSFFKVKRNIIALVIFLVPFLLPAAAFGGDVIAYCMGYHHGFKEPWPAIQTALYISFAVIVLVFIAYVIVTVIIQNKSNKKEIESNDQ